MSASTFQVPQLRSIEVTPPDIQLAALVESQRVTFVVDTNKAGWQGNIRAQWTTIFPKDQTPAFLIDLGEDYKKIKSSDAKAVETLRWRVIEVAKLPEADIGAAKILYDEGWTAISYAWGEYMPDKQSRQVFQGGRIASQLTLALGDEYELRYTEPNNAYDWLVPSCPSDQDPHHQENLSRDGQAIRMVGLGLHSSDRFQPGL
jgi:hypothetical protein